jgi:hypothetical protein
MDPDEVLVLALNRTPNIKAFLVCLPGYDRLVRLQLGTIFDVEAKRGIDEIIIIVGLRPENGDLGDSLLAQLGFVLHEEVCDCCAVRRTWSPSATATL